MTILLIVLVISIIYNVRLSVKIRKNEELYNKDVVVLQEFAYDIADKYDTLRNLYNHLN